MRNPFCTLELIRSKAEGKMKVITGDETGLIKLVNSSKNELKSFGEQSRELGVKVSTFNYVCNAFHVY